MKTSCAVYLLAGRGIRLGQKTDDIPKCLIEVSNQSLLERSVNHMRSLGVKEVIFVVGYKAERIRSVFGNNWNDINIHYVENEVWETTNNVVSLDLAIPYLETDFYLLEGDLIFEYSEIDKMSIKPNSMAVAPFESYMNGTVITLHNNKQVSQFYLGNENNAEEIYKTVNIYHFEKLGFHNGVVPELKKLLNSGEQQCYYELAIAKAVQKRSIQLDGVIFDNDKWYEIDTESDLNKARSMFR